MPSFTQLKHVDNSVLFKISLVIEHNTLIIQFKQSSKSFMLFRNKKSNFCKLKFTQITLIDEQQLHHHLKDLLTQQLINLFLQVFIFFFEYLYLVVLCR